NEKAAMEVAAGAAYTGARTMVTMKQVGLNVAADPLMSLAYIGVKGGMVIMVADDPGPISSQTEQDTRTFAQFSKLPCFDPSSVQEAYEMIQDAFAYSEQYHTPVFFRPTTRVCHGYASVTVKEESECLVNKPEGFIKDSKKWVIFPRLSYQSHILIEERNEKLSDVFSSYSRNEILNKASHLRKGIATHGISFSYTMDGLKQFAADPKILKVATPFPFPEQLAYDFLKDLDEVLCIEELDPVIERALTAVCGKYHLDVKIYGKMTKHVALAGENTCDSVISYIGAFLGEGSGNQTEYITLNNDINLPVRPPVLCAGCPHRASFFAVKEAMKGKKSLFCGDIGCYTLGNAMPLDMVDTCLCMGAGVNMAQGIGHIEPDTTCFAFVGDSTFFASAITGVVNAMYNNANMTLVVLDNSTTAMTGHQPHPGTGVRMMDFANGNIPKSHEDIANKINIEQVLRGIGVEIVETVNPLDLQAAIDCVKQVSSKDGVKAIIFKSPCIALCKTKYTAKINTAKCINCKKCIRSLGCPAITIIDGQVTIDTAQCTNCMLCEKVCPVSAITSTKEDAANE
ncbi:MAG: thiamine pyrophosphate-dependent enzyme, partial [Lachnospiraceae bacterium]